MSTFEDLLNKNSYDELSPKEKAELAELCADEHEFALLKTFLDRSTQSIPVIPPESLFNALNDTFDATYEPKTLSHKPSAFNIYIVAAIAASIVALFIVFWFSSSENSSNHTAKVKTKKQLSPNVKTRDNKRIANKSTSEQPLLAEIKTTNKIVENDAILDEFINKEPLIAIAENDDSTPEVLTPSSGDVDLKDKVLNEEAGRTAKEVSTYEWTMFDNKRKDDELASVGVMSKKSKNQNKRLNNALFLKKIKPMY